MTTTQTPSTFGDVVVSARRGFAREPGLTAVGVAGLVISFLSLIAVVVRGTFIPPEGKMLDAVTFSFGVAVFVLTMSLVLPLAGFSDRGRRRWRRLFYVFPVYGFVLEPLQAFRGLDPRFTEVGGAVDVVAGIVFGATAALGTVLFVILGLRFFRRDVLHDDLILRWGIRYGVVAVWISFGLGIVMSVMGGREFGEAGNLIPAHGLGAHGIQTIPIVALLLVWARVAKSEWIHYAGMGWLLACVAVAFQALLGQAPFGPSLFTGLVVIGLVTWGVVAIYALRSWLATPVVEA